MFNEMLILCIISISLFSCYNRDEKVDINNLIGNDYRLFQQTPIWDLAKAVEDENTAEIEQIISKNKNLIDYPDPKYGNTLLSLAVSNNQLVSVKKLLELGADPNKHDKYEGSTPVIDACLSSDPEILKLLLYFGGDPNSTQNAPLEEDSLLHHERTFALRKAAAYDIRYVKLLVEAGADVNKTDSLYNEGALEIAIIQDNFEIALYLLNNGADYKKKMSGTNEIPKVDILYLLRLSIVPLDSKTHSQKIQVIDFLKNKGLNYWTYPIPERVINQAKRRYPDEWQEYLKK